MAIQSVRLTTSEAIKRFVGQESDWHVSAHPREYHISSVWRCFRQVWMQKRLVPTGEVGLDSTTNDWLLGLFEMARRVEQVLHDSLAFVFGHRFIRNNVPVAVFVDTDTKTLVPVDPTADKDDLVAILDANPNYILIVGETDPVRLGWNGKWLTTYECKSSAKGAASQPTGAHKHQGGFYASMLGTDLEIVMPSRNSVTDLATHQVPAAELPQLLKETIDYFVTLHNLLNSADLPPARPLADFECDRCPLKSACTERGGWDKKEREITRGKNKGEIRVEWVRKETALDPAGRNDPEP